MGRGGGPYIPGVIIVIVFVNILCSFFLCKRGGGEGGRGTSAVIRKMFQVIINSPVVNKKQLISSFYPNKGPYLAVSLRRGTIP